MKEKTFRKFAVTCCWTSLNKSQQATSLFLINRCYLCLMPKVKTLISFTNTDSKTTGNVTTAYTSALRNTHWNDCRSTA